MPNRLVQLLCPGIGLSGEAYISRIAQLGATLLMDRKALTSSLDAVYGRCLGRRPVRRKGLRWAHPRSYTLGFDYEDRQ